MNDKPPDGAGAEGHDASPLATPLNRRDLVWNAAKLTAAAAAAGPFFHGHSAGRRSRAGLDERNSR